MQSNCNQDPTNLITIRLGFVIIYLNQSSERNMIDIPGCSELTNFKYVIVLGKH
jgi:hypothetical protein